MNRIKNLFRGFQPCAGNDNARGISSKAPVPFLNPRTKQFHTTFKNIPDSEYLTYEEIQHEANYGGRLKAGIIVIDIDNNEEAEKLRYVCEVMEVKTCIVKTTKGMHFYFLTPKNIVFHSQKIKTLLRIGIEGDFLFGKERFIALKLDGIERQILKQEEDIEELPFWLFPIQKTNIVKRFSEVRQGERDNSLFSYQVALAKQGLTDIEIKTIISIIAKYILPEPLSDIDIERLTRPEALQGAALLLNTDANVPEPLRVFMKGKTIQYDLYAKHLIEKLHIMKKYNKLFLYKENRYVAHDEEFSDISRYVAQHDFPNIRHSVHVEIIKAIKRNCEYEKEEAPPELIAFANGYVNVKEMDEEGKFTLHKHTPDIFFTNVIPHNYNPNANTAFISETFGTYANQDPDIIKILEEIPGICLYRSSSQGIDPQAFVLIGTKSNGKSTYLNLLYQFLGRENVSATDPQRFGERFEQAALCSKLANIVADLNEDTIRNAGLFKAIVSGDTIEGEEKYGTKFSFNPFCTLIFSCNNIPNIRDDSEAILRRLTIVPFLVEFHELTADRSIGQKLMTEENIEALALLALRGLNRILMKNDGSVTQSKTFNDLKEEYSIKNNSLRAFIEDFKEIHEDGFTGRRTSDVYQQYVNFCLDAGIRYKKTLIQFVAEVKKLEGLNVVRKRDAGNRFRYFE